MLLWIAVPLMARQTGPQAGQHVHAGTLHKEHKLLLRVSLGFAAWGASSAVIQGASVPLVAWLMPAGATPFFLAFTLVTVIIGAMMAAANALVSPVAAMLARAERAAAARLARRASAVVWLMANLALAAVYLALPQVLALWTGARGPSADIEAAAVRPYFALLALQHGIRSAGIVPSIVLAAGAVPRTLLRAVLPESSVAVLLALPLGFMMGPTGFLTALAAAAAAGTLAASAFAASGPLKSGQDASKHDDADRRVALMPTAAGLTLASVILWTAAAWSGWR